MAELDSYSIDNVIVIVGVLPISGFHEGDDVIQLSRSVPTFQMPIGADGNGVAVRSADRSGKIVLRLQQTSLSNAYLAGQLAAMERGLIASLPFLLKDKGTLLQLAAAAHCVIEQPPDQPFGTALNVREWTLLAEELILA